LRPNDPLQPTDGEESSDEAAVILPAVVGPVVVLVLLLVVALIWLHRRSRTMTPSLRTEEAVDGGTRKWWRVEDDKSGVELS
jgi:heme/copper-type cytochrome/quinol oxidase subunit 2